MWQRQYADILMFFSRFNSDRNKVIETDYMLQLKYRGCVSYQRILEVSDRRAKLSQPKIILNPVVSLKKHNAV